ncbi:sarcosine oxidase subunit gamma [Bradyrhizobium sp. 1.29L]
MAEQPTSVWRPCGAWAGVAKAGQFGDLGKAGVTTFILDNMGFATLIAKAKSADLDRATQRLLGLDLPGAGSAVLSSTHGVVWSGPDQWLLLARQRAAFSDLLALFSDHAAVSDQSHARAALRVSGEKARNVLEKGAMVDLHPAAFPIGATALTSFAHVGVQLWRGEDGPNGAVFEILVPRSMASSFWSWFTASAAEFGCRVMAGRA